MAKTIIVGGFGPGISSAVAQKFGEAGFSVALVGRSEDRLAAGVKALGAKSVKAGAFPADLSDPASVRSVVGKVRSAFGSVDVLHWNAYGSGGGDLLKADAAAIHALFDVAIGGLLTAVQECLPDLRKHGESAILVTNGGLGYFDPTMDAMAVQWGAMGLAVTNAAKHKLVGLLAEKLKGDGVYVGEVMVLGTVKGSAFDRGSAGIEASAIADKFWHLYTTRKQTTTEIG